MRILLTAAAILLLTGCGATHGRGGAVGGGAPLRGFGIDVDRAVSDRIPALHVRTCGTWGCHDQDVPLAISGPTRALPCTGAAPEAACGVERLPGVGPGYGYAPVPGLTLEPVTVTVRTPPGAPLTVDAELRVRPHLVCPGDGSRAGGGRTGGAEPSCAGGAAQAQLRVTADATVIQSR